MIELHSSKRVSHKNLIVASSSIGLADALVEITRIHAGSLGIYDKTELAGLARIVGGGRVNFHGVKNFIEITSILFGATVALHLLVIAIVYLTGITRRWL